jgi:hypothetical protein
MTAGQGDDGDASEEFDSFLKLVAHAGAPPVPGAMFADRFRILSIAGRGGFGTVYRAHDERTAQDVALKVIHDGTADLQRFEREAELLATVRHPNVVSYVAHGLTEDGDPYLAMEWLEGIDLAHRLAMGAPSVQEALTIAVRAAQGLAAAHALGIVHRDVKPSNLYLVGSAYDDVRVIDFGVARAPAPASVLTATGAVIGTPAYMAPEQARGARDLTPRVDVFALGCVLFECLTGAPPFVGQNAQALLARLLSGNAPRLSERRPDVPPGLDALLARMLAHDPADRFSDASVLAMATAAMLGDATRSSLAFAGAPIVTGRAMRAYSRVVVRASHGAPLPTRLDELVASLGGEVVGRGDEFLVAAFVADSAADGAQRAARCAVALRDREGSLRIGVTTTRRDTAITAPSAVEEHTGVFAEEPASGEIVVDAMTAAHAGDDYEVDPRGALLTLKSRRRRVAESAEGLIGRSREIATLEGVCQEVVGERCARVALVFGESGAGKTRLLGEMLRRLGRTTSKVTVLRAFGDRPTSTSPFALLGQLVRWRHDADGVTDVPTLSQVDSDFLGELAGLRITGEEPPHVRAARRDPMLMADAFRNAWLGFVDGLLLTAPLLLLVENLHHADLASLRLIDAALEQFAERSLLVVGTARSEGSADTLGLFASRDPERITLRPLRPAVATELVRAAAADASPETVARIVERGAGNPLYLLELARQGEQHVPLDSAMSAVEARLARLEPFARRVLRAGSVFGAHFSSNGLCALLGGEARRDAIHRALAEAEEQRFVVSEDGGGWSFRHGLVQEAAYETLTDPERSAAHAAVGRWLAEQAGIIPSLVAWHFERAAEREDAFRWYEAAARAALQGRDLERVFLLCDHALACQPQSEPRARIALMRAEAALMNADTAEGTRAATQAMETARPGSTTWTGAAGILITSAGQTGDNAGVARLAEIVKAQPAEDDALAQWVIGLARAATQLMSAGNPTTSRALLAVAERSETKDPIALAWIERLRAAHCVLEHDYDRAIAMQTEAARLAAAAGDVRNACLCRVLLASVHIFAGDFEGASAELDVAEPMARRTGAEYFARWASYARGKILALAGEPAVAREHLDRVRRELAGNPRIVAGTHVYAALAALRARDGGWAETEARAAMAAHDAPAIRGAALAALARALIQVGRAPEARRAAEDASGVLRTMGSIEENEGVIHLAAVEALLANGLEADARSAAQVALDRLAHIAGKLSSPARRERYLHGIEVHAETLRLALQLGIS